MVRHHDWYDPAVIKRVRVRITIVLWVIAAFMLYLNHSWILKLLQTLF